MELPKSNEQFTSPLHILRCLGQLAVWRVQDWLIDIDNAIVELPDE